MQLVSVVYHCVYSQIHPLLFKFTNAHDKKYERENIQNDVWKIRSRSYNLSTKGDWYLKFKLNCKGSADVDFKFKVNFN